MLLGDCYADFYGGDVESALARLREQWRGIMDAHLLRISVLRVQLWQLLATSQVAVAHALLARGQRASARELLVEARQTARKLGRDPMRRAPLMGAMVEAAVDACEGDRPAAVRRLKECAKGFDEQGMRLFAAAARVRLGGLAGGQSGSALIESGLGDLRSEDVAAPSRMLDLLAPGFGGA